MAARVRARTDEVVDDGLRVRKRARPDDRIELSFLLRLGALDGLFPAPGALVRSSRRGAWDGDLGLAFTAEADVVGPALDEVAEPGAGWETLHFDVRADTATYGEAADAASTPRRRDPRRRFPGTLVMRATSSRRTRELAPVPVTIWAIGVTDPDGSWHLFDCHGHWGRPGPGDTQIGAITRCHGTGGCAPPSPCRCFGVGGVGRTCQGFQLCFCG